MNNNNDNNVDDDVSDDNNNNYKQVQVSSSSWLKFLILLVSLILRRLTPTYMFVLLFWNKLTVFLGEGPNWLNYQSDEACNKYWWTNLLYINNFYPTKFGASVSC